MPPELANRLERLDPWSEDRRHVDGLSVAFVLGLGSARFSQELNFRHACLGQTGTVHLAYPPSCSVSCKAILSQQTLV